MADEQQEQQGQQQEQGQEQQQGAALPDPAVPGGVPAEASTKTDEQLGVDADAQREQAEQAESEES